jgi:hypothetical protein
MNGQSKGAHTRAVHAASLRKNLRVAFSARAYTCRCRSNDTYFERSCAAAAVTADQAKYRDCVGSCAELLPLRHTVAEHLLIDWHSSRPLGECAWYSEALGVDYLNAAGGGGTDDAVNAQFCHSAAYRL